MTAINNLFLAAGMLPQLQASGSKANSSENADAFAAMFRRSSDSGGVPLEPIQGANPCTVQVAATDLPEEQPLLELEDDDIPEELLALVAAVITPVIQEQVIIPGEGTIPDAIPSADIIAEIDANVVSNLESNKEIEAPAENKDVNVNVQEFKTPELTARMPQTSEQPELPDEDVLPKTETAAKTETDVPCPLENENNKIESKSETAPASSKRENEQEKPPQDTRVFGNSQPVDISPERVISTEQLSQTVETAPQTATVDTLYNTLVESVYTASTSESKFMEIQLKPEFLGKVAIQLTLGDAGLEIKIKADDAGVKGLIANQITQLTSSLKDKGVEISNVEVVFANVADHSYDGSAPRQQNSQQPGRSSRNISLDFGLGFTEELDAVTVVDAGMASVEYRV